MSSVDVSTRELERTLTNRDVQDRWMEKRIWIQGGELLPPANAALISRTRDVQVSEDLDVTELETTTIDRGLTRSGVQFQVNERIDTQSIGTRLVSREIIPFMRSRNVDFQCSRIKPRTQFYTFFDGEDVTRFVTPKILEVTMEQGVFKLVRLLEVFINDTLFLGGSSPEINFRVAQTNHKYGSYDNPTIVYDVNPYSDTVNFSSTYSATSSVLNVDVASLSFQVLGSFNGYAFRA